MKEAPQAPVRETRAVCSELGAALMMLVGPFLHWCGPGFLVKSRANDRERTPKLDLREFQYQAA